MSDYGFVHDGKVFTPNGTQDVPAAANDDRNQAIEAGELARWQEQPAMQLAYFKFPADAPNGRLFNRGTFHPPLFAHKGDVITDRAHVTTWLGTRIGTIMTARVYPHNFGGRFVALTVHGTNGASYYGRASWDNGTCVWLRRAKGRAA